MFDFAIDTGVNSAKPIDWEKLFSQRSKVHDVSTAAALDAALKIVQPTEGIRLAPGTYTGGASRRNISQPDVVVGPARAGEPGERLTTLNGGQYAISGARALLGGVRITSSGVAPLNMIIMSGVGSRLEDFDLIDINTKTEKSRVVVIDRRAHDSVVRRALVAGITGFAVVLDSPQSEGVAQRVSITHSTFARCSSYYFQAGQWGNEVDQSFSEFAYNQVRDSDSAEIKVSDFFCHHNSFYRVGNGFNFRIGARNTLERNRFEGGRRACRIFGADHRILNNIVITPELFSIIIAEGSLLEQFREHSNAHHVVAQRILVAGNTLQHGARGGILIGDVQTGMLGVGKRGASSPGSADWPHYEPYSPSEVTARNNTFIGTQGLGIAIRRPTTRPASGDQYPAHETLNKYIGIKLHENTFLLSGAAQSGVFGDSAQYTSWSEAAETWDNIVEPLQLLSR